MAAQVFVHQKYLEYEEVVLLQDRQTEIARQTNGGGQTDRGGQTEVDGQILLDRLTERD